MALGCSTKASFLHPPGPPRALRERCAHPFGTCEAAGGQGWGLERSKRRGSQGCRGPYSPCPGRRQLCRCDKSAWGLQGSRSSPWRLGSRQSQRRGNPSPMCPRKWLCTLCRGSGEQSCLLTTVGGDPEAMIPPGAGWGVQSTVGTLWLTSVGPQPRVHPDMAAGVASALWDQQGPGRGRRSSWKPAGEEMGAAAEVHHGTYQRAIWTRKCLWPAGWKCLCQQDYSPGTMGSRSPTA